MEFNIATRAKKVNHILHVPFSGLGLYGGYRGDKWLKNRIAIFKNFVLPSLLNQTNQNFILNVAWRPEERGNPIVMEFQNYLKHTSLQQVVFTYYGILFWDDKYPDDIAEKRLRESLKWTLRELKKYIDDGCEWILWTIQPSDDCYMGTMVQDMQAQVMEEKAVGYEKGYIMRYDTKEISDYDPTTHPPFYTIFYPREKFLDADKHYEYIHNKSHEYVKDFLKYEFLRYRGFIVGCHGENISTGYDIPFRGEKLPVPVYVLKSAGIYDSLPFKTSRGWKRLYFKLPHKVRRKIRYWLGEKFYVKFYNFINYV